MTNLPAIRSTVQKQVASNVKLPTWIDFTGTLKGTTQYIDAQLKMKSQLGSADIVAQVDLMKDNEQFDVNISAKDLAIGKLIGQDSLLGKATFKLTAKGTLF